MARKKKALLKQMQKVFKARSGAQITDADAVVIGERIDTLMDKHGGELTPSQLLEDARKVRSPIHKFFDWDDSEAAEKWRTHQARQLISSVVVTVEVKGRQHDMRSFHNVTNQQHERVYVTLETVGNTPSYAQQLIDDAQSNLLRLTKLLDLLRPNIK